tara:strand:+ start:291 stop:404 length:114 start_codon:yes stop_codon:yes gene_type:complete
MSQSDICGAQYSFVAIANRVSVIGMRGAETDIRNQDQ